MDFDNCFTVIYNVSKFPVRNIRPRCIVISVFSEYFPIDIMNDFNVTRYAA